MTPITALLLSHLPQPLLPYLHFAPKTHSLKKPALPMHTGYHTLKWLEPPESKLCERKLQTLYKSC